MHIADVTQGGVDAEHIAMMDPATTLALVAEVRELKNAARLMQSVLDAKYDRFAEIADIPAEEARCMDPQLIEEAALDRVRELRAKVERVREVIGDTRDLDPDQGGCEGAWDGQVLKILDALEGEEA